MRRFSVYCELAGGDYALGWVDTIEEALAIVATCGNKRTRIWDRNSRYLDSNDGFWRQTTEKIYIVAAAIKDDTGKVWTLDKPARHYDIIRLMRESGYTGPVAGPDQQGFMLSNGNFCRRKAAMRVAEQANQIKNGKPISSILTTEDLW